MGRAVCYRWPGFSALRSLDGDTMTDAPNPSAAKAGSEFTQYRRSQIAELRPYVPGESPELLYRVSISQADLDGGSPKDGDMIARNPANHDDQWLVAADYFAANFEPLYTHPQPSLSVGLDREAVARIVFGIECPHESWESFDERFEARGNRYHPTQEKALQIADAIIALAAPAEGYVVVPVDTLAEALFTADRLRKNVTPDWIGLPREYKDEWRSKAACLPAAPTGASKS